MQQRCYIWDQLMGSCSGTGNLVLQRSLSLVFMGRTFPPTFKIPCQLKEVYGDRIMRLQHARKWYCVGKWANMVSLMSPAHQG